jgi:hypothetical protein
MRYSVLYAMRAAKNLAVLFDAVADDSATTVSAQRR